VALREGNYLGVDRIQPIGSVPLTSSSCWRSPPDISSLTLDQDELGKLPFCGEAGNLFTPPGHCRAGPLLKSGIPAWASPRFLPQIAQQRVALAWSTSPVVVFSRCCAHRDHPDVAGDLVGGGKATGIAEKYVGGQGRHRSHARMRQQPACRFSNPKTTFAARIETMTYSGCFKGFSEHLYPAGPVWESNKTFTI
jgi:hypothetical protein